MNKLLNTFIVIILFSSLNGTFVGGTYISWYNQIQQILQLLSYGNKNLHLKWNKCFLYRKPSPPPYTISILYNHYTILAGFSLSQIC